ncbi:MAG: alpha/beta fold hydrolase [Sulfuritalea sp.]|jgi:triacylglycerol lipase|nr:alpha/beta fold hydrolase [Sulfuritalea sp.]
MAARQFRWLLFCELLAYAVLGHWLTSRAGWTLPQAAGLALAGFLGLRLFVVGLTFALMRQGNSEVPPELRVGPVGALRMVLEECAAMILLFAVIQPFEAFWLGPDRLGKPAAGRLPVLLIHGYQCNRGFWFWLRPRLEAAGWTVATHSLEPVFSDIDAYADGIARRIDEVLAATGTSQLILVGHSMGGLALRAYLRRHGAGKVARLITLGSPHQGTELARLGLGPNARQMRVNSPWLRGLAAPLPATSVSIYSCHDNYVFPQQACSTLQGAANVAIGGVSHLGMAFSASLRGKLLQALEAPTP